jgi:hypothetical protein
MVILSRRWLSMLGHSTQSFGTTLDATWARINEDDQPAMRESLQTLRPGKGARNSCRPSSACCAATATGSGSKAKPSSPSARPAASPLRTVITARDIAEQRAAEDRYQLSAKLFQHLHEGLLITERKPPRARRQPDLLCHHRLFA